MLGSCGVLARVVVARRLPWLAEAPRLLALAVAFTAAVVGVHLLPGVVGLLTRGTVTAVAVLAAAAAWRWIPAVSGERERVPAPPWWSLAPAVLLGGFALALLYELAGAPITSIDAQNFQVPIVVRWLQEESLWGLHQFVADYSNATYPQNGNLLVAAVMLPFDAAFLARLVAAPYWALAGIGVYAVAREAGAPRSAAALAGAALTAVPVMARAGLEGVQTDAPMLACTAAGVLFLLRHHRTGRRAELVVAGVALGLAFGTKWYAVPGVVAVLAVWLLARRRVWPDAAIAAGLVAAAGGFWLLRNLVEAGNPLFPQPFGPFPAPPDPLRALGGFTLLHYAFDLDVWRTYLRPAFAHTFGTTGLLLAGGGVVALLLRPRGPALAIALGTLALAALYVVTPYSAFGPEGRPVLAAASTRYGLPALMGAAVLCAWLAGRRAPVLVHAMLGVAVVAGIGRAFEIGVVRPLAATLVLAAALALPRRALAAVAVAVALAAIVVVNERAADQGYGQFDPTLEWIERHAPSGRRIGLAGVWSTERVAPPLPAFGPRFGNEVEYVGEFREHMLRRFRTAEAFAAAARGFDLLLLAPGAELEWARADGWSEVVRSDRLVLLRRDSVAGG